MNTVVNKARLIADEDPNKLSNIVLKQLTTLIAYQAEEIQHLRENVNNRSKGFLQTPKNNLLKGFDQVINYNFKI